MLAIIVAILAFCLLSLTAMYSRNFGRCLQFPNGSEIGYEAIVDFGGPYFRPDAVLRLPQIGIVAKEVWPIHITEKATYGWAWPGMGSETTDFRFIWTTESGLVRENEDTILYRKLETHLGHVYQGAAKDQSVNTLWFLTHFEGASRFEGEDCETQLWTW